MEILKWTVFHAALDPVVGSEQAKARPALVLSEDFVNAVLSVVTIAPFTTKKSGRTIYPNEVLIPATAAGLKADSILLCHQIRSLDKQRFLKVYGVIIDAHLQWKIGEALKFHFGLQ